MSMVHWCSVLDKLVDVMLCAVLRGGHLEHVGHAQQSLVRLVCNHLQLEEYL